jgi:dTDP-4-amino-4,6-dideoxygalactose transaminase
MFSFHATKLFHTAEGGALAAPDPALRRRIELLRSFGLEGDDVSLPGLNGKVDELRAVMGLAVLDVMEAERERRAALFAAYNEALAGVPGVATPTPTPGQTLSYQYYPVRIDESFGVDRDTLHARLAEFNVHARRYFYPLVPDYSCYRDSPACRTEEIPVARRVVREVLCLPCYGALGPEGARRIVEMIRFIRG